MRILHAASATANGFFHLMPKYTTVPEAARPASVASISNDAERKSISTQGVPRNERTDATERTAGANRSPPHDRRADFVAFGEQKRDARNERHGDKQTDVCHEDSFAIDGNNRRGLERSGTLHTPHGNSVGQPLSQSIVLNGGKPTSNVTCW